MNMSILFEESTYFIGYVFVGSTYRCWRLSIRYKLSGHICEQINGLYLIIVNKNKNNIDLGCIFAINEVNLWSFIAIMVKHFNR